MCPRPLVASGRRDVIDRVSGAARGLFAFPSRGAIVASMKQARPFLNLVVAATLTFASIAALSGIAGAQVVAGALPGAGADTAEAPEDEAHLLEQLARPDQPRWSRIERQLMRLWSQSGSAVIDYLFQRGEAALEAGQATAAIGHFSAVIDHDPAFAEGWNGRASAYFLANRLGQSLADLEQVLRLNPHHFGALAGLGMILEQLDRPEEALRAYEASLAIHPHQPRVLEAVAQLALASAGQAL